jgi:tol-pal system protein YbgF
MIKFSKPAIAATVLALSAALPLHARAGLLDDDEARRAIIDLRAKVDNIVKELNARIDTKSDKSSALEFTNQHEQAMAEIARLRGQIEVLANDIAVAQKRQRELYADLDARLKKLEPREVTVDGAKAEVDPNEQKTYDAAVAVFRGGDYAGATRALSDFVKRYPGSVFAANAQYALGTAYYALGDHKKSIAAHQQLLAEYADNPKAADAMLNIATSQKELKDKKAEKKTLQDLVAKYPGTPSAQAAKERLKALK